jgi:hypothetical protein
MLPLTIIVVVVMNLSTGKVVKFESMGAAEGRSTADECARIDYASLRRSYQKRYPDRYVRVSCRAQKPIPFPSRRASLPQQPPGGNVCVDCDPMVRIGGPVDPK